MSPCRDYCGCAGGHHLPNRKDHFRQDLIKIHLPLLPLLAVMSCTLASKLVPCAIARRMKQPPVEQPNSKRLG
jgi:hypothetical protein